MYLTREIVYDPYQYEGIVCIRTGRVCNHCRYPSRALGTPALVVLIMPTVAHESGEGARRVCLCI